MNHIYKDIPGCFTWPEFYSALAKELKAKGKTKGVELGTFNGQSLAYLAVELINLDADCHVDGIDIRNDSGEASRYLAPVESIVSLMAAVSWEAANAYEDGSLDFVLIDAEHSYESVSKDIAAWKPKVKEGGLICGHDYSSDYPGVLRAVSEAFTSWEVHRGEVYDDGKFYPVWSVRVGLR